MIFYQVKLSAILQLLLSIRNETKVERRDIIRTICIAAYPDIQPWQVRKACYDLGKDSKPGQQVESWLEEFYYTYLSMLLHPIEGNDAARHDGLLVKVRNEKLAISCVFTKSICHSYMMLPLGMVSMVSGNQSI